jgi:oligoribonuclease NrnB/cAMP/cGMP phosphodiesterase (DHH superfamily)
MTFSPDICFYHANCADGFTAAWVVWEKYGDIDFRPVSYGKELLYGIEGKNIIVVDFSFSPEMMAYLEGAARTVVVLDHHKTAAENLSMYDNQFRLDHRVVCVGETLVEFDMTRSGAMMAWDFCFPSQNPPRLVRMVQDRDLWLWRIDGSREISILLTTIPKEFKDWRAFSVELETRPSVVLQKAKLLQGFYDGQIDKMCQTAVMVNFLGYDGVPVLFIPYQFASDACSKLLSLYPVAPFAAAITVRQDGFSVSLRSEDARTDVSGIARRLGGGGHRNAAGCSVKELDDILQRQSQSLEAYGERLVA